MPTRVFVTHLPRVIRFHNRAARNMLLAAATVVQNQAKRNVRGGFKSGDFVTGTLINKIDVEVEDDHAEIGTEVDYGAFWEVGHNNIFTRKYEREEWLRPAMEKTKKEQQKAAVKAARRTR